MIYYVFLIIVSLLLLLLLKIQVEIKVIIKDGKNFSFIIIRFLVFFRLRMNLSLKKDGTSLIALTLRKIDSDTETKPSFKKGSVNQTSLLQLSTANEAFLFRLNKTGLCPSLIKLLESTKLFKVGVGIRDDIRGLNQLARFKPGRFVELQDVAKNFGIDVFSLKGLAGLMLEVRVSKRQRLSNWEADTLTQAQIDYAAIDAWIALRLYEEFVLLDPLYKFKSIVYRN